MLKLWLYKFLTLFVGASLTPVAPITKIEAATLDEMLSFECARDVALSGPGDKELGPLFFRQGIAMTSLTTSAGQDVLLVNGGAGQYSVNLPTHGMSRVRFSLPVAGTLEQKFVFVSFLPGGRTDSRLFDLTVSRPPLGRDDLDYQYVPIRRSTYLLSHFEYAIFETADQIAGGLASRKLDYRQYAVTNPSSCDYLSRRSPAVARNLRYNLEVIDTLTKPPKTLTASSGGRFPASVTSKQN